MKQPRVSVIVPTKNSAEFLDACLKSIVEQTYKNIELIVVDNNSSDKTKEIAKKYTRKVYDKGPERSAQRNYGVAQAKGEYVLIIDSDMELTPKVIEACVGEVQHDQKIKGVVIPEESFGEGFWAKCKRLERSFYIGIPWMEAARFFERKTFDHFNGYDEMNTGTEDYDLPQRIQNKYPNSIVRINELIYHNEQHISLMKTCSKKYYYAKRLDAYRADPANYSNFKKQSNPLQRFALFFSKPKKLFRHPIIGIGMLYMKVCEYLAGGFGYTNHKVFRNNAFEK